MPKMTPEEFLLHKVTILQSILIGEMFEAGQLGDFQNGLTGARFDHDDVDDRLVKAFRVVWNEDFTFEVRPV